jgi:hypothetical protein
VRGREETVAAHSNETATGGRRFVEPLANGLGCVQLVVRRSARVGARNLDHVSVARHHGVQFACVVMLVLREDYAVNLRRAKDPPPLKMTVPSLSCSSSRAFAEQYVRGRIRLVLPPNVGNDPQHGAEDTVRSRVAHPKGIGDETGHALPTRTTWKSTYASNGVNTTRVLVPVVRVPLPCQYVQRSSTPRALK